MLGWICRMLIEWGWVDPNLPRMNYWRIKDGRRGYED